MLGFEKEKKGDDFVVSAGEYGSVFCTIWAVWGQTPISDNAIAAA